MKFFKSRRLIFIQKTINNSHFKIVHDNIENNTVQIVAFAVSKLSKALFISIMSKIITRLADLGFYMVL